MFVGCSSQDLLIRIIVTLDIKIYTHTRTICSHFVSSLLSSTKFANEPLINWRDSIRRFTGGGEKHI